MRQLEVHLPDQRVPSHYNVCTSGKTQHISAAQPNDLTLRAVWLNYHVFLVKFPGMKHCLCWQ